MSIESVNLLSNQRKVRVYERRLGKRWILGGTVYCALLLLAWGAVSTGVAKESGVRSELQSVEERLSKKTSEGAGLQAQVAASRRQYEAARAVGHHPDWSVLLTVAALERGNDIVLETCQLKRVATIQSKSPKSPTGGTEQFGKVVFEMTGVALRSQSVQTYVLALEDTGLFESVSAKGNTRDAARVGGPSLHSFTIVCEMVEPWRGVEQ